MSITDSPHLHSLLSRDANADIVDGTGCSPLYFALKKRNLLLALDLLVRHCNIGLNNGDGGTGLHLPIRAKGIGVVSLLLSRGANVDACSSQELYSLDLAIQTRDIFGPPWKSHEARCDGSKRPWPQRV